jgi:GNAT superfamily N-acetyltransferase
MAVARVHVGSWQAAYRGLMPDAYLDGLRAEDRAARYDFANPGQSWPYTIVVENGGAIRGFVSTRETSEPEVAGYGELCALYVDPEHWGRGLGAALVAAGRERLSGLGFRKAFLWVLVGNVRADRFYRIDGWQPDGMRRTATVWDATVEEIRYQRDLEIAE